MKNKILIALGLIILNIGCAFAQSQFSPTITRMETSLFGIDYQTQTDEARIKRIEERVYGKSFSSPLSQRLAKLSKDLQADVMGSEIKPQKDTFAEDDSANEESIPKADSNIKYPIVDKMEKSIFGNPNQNTDINKRLAILEQKTFNKTYSDDLNSRVERLKAEIMPRDQETLAQDSSNFDPNNMFEQNFPTQDDPLSGPSFWQKRKAYVHAPSNYNDNNSVLDSYEGTNDLDVRLGAVEKSVLKRTFPNDSVDNRLTRLEGQMFNTSFNDDSPQTRLDRISSATRAARSARRYDGNKAQQRFSTAIQIGALLLMVLAAVI